VRGYDAGKKIKGRKRHLAVDTLGLPIKCQITGADVQDRDALPGLLAAVSRKSPWVTLAFVDGGYAGDETERAPAGCVIFSQSRHVNFSRTVSITFHWRG
jgi:hypothetical protein